MFYYCIRIPKCIVTLESICATRECYTLNSFRLAIFSDVDNIWKKFGINLEISINTNIGRLIYLMTIMIIILVNLRRLSRAYNGSRNNCISFCLSRTRFLLIIHVFFRYCLVLYHICQERCQ